MDSGLVAPRCPGMTKGVICPTGCFAKGVSSPFQKNISILQNRKPPYIPRCPVPPKGRIMIVANAGRDAVDAGGAQDESAECGRRRRVVLAPRRWCQVCVKSRRRRWPKSPEHRGERAVIRKTIAWGMPGESGVTCMLVCAFYPILHTRPWGASSARHSLRPFQGRGDRNQANLAQTHAARMRRCVLPSLRAQRSNPPLSLLRHGLLRCARNDVVRLFEIRNPRSPDERSEIRGRSFVHSRMSLRSSGLRRHAASGTRRKVTHSDYLLALRREAHLV
jgi:hypothetical protein